MHTIFFSFIFLVKIYKNIYFIFIYLSYLLPVLYYYIFSFLYLGWPLVYISFLLKRVSLLPSGSKYIHSFIHSFIHFCETAGKLPWVMAGNKHCVFACQLILLLIHFNSSAFIQSYCIFICYSY